MKNIFELVGVEQQKGKGIYLFLIIYKIVLDYSYVVASSLYAYRGIELDFNATKYIISWLIMIILSFPVFKKKDTVGAMVLQMLFIMLVVPVLTLYAMKNRSDSFVLMLAFAFMLQAILVNYSRTTREIIRINHSQVVLHIILLLITCLTYAILLLKNRPSLSALNLTSIYDIRDDVDYGFALIRYTAVWQYRVINPYYMIYGLKKRNYKIVTAFILLQLLAYLIVARKEVLFAPVLILGVYWMLNKFDFGKMFTLGITGLVTFCTLIYKCLAFKLPFAIVPVRLLFDPAMIDFMFYEQFSTNLNKLYYSESHLGMLFGMTYQYDKPSGWVVNDIYFPTIEAEANTGYLSYGYANMGFIGMLIASILLVLILKLLDRQSGNKKYVFAFCAYPFSVLVNGGLLTALLTGGILLLIIIVFFDEAVFRSKESDKSINLSTVEIQGCFERY